jgi:hypothetical protein
MARRAGQVVSRETEHAEGAERTATISPSRRFVKNAGLRNPEVGMLTRATNLDRGVDSYNGRAEIALFWKSGQFVDTTADPAVGEKLRVGARPMVPQVDMLGPAHARDRPSRGRTGDISPFSPFLEKKFCDLHSGGD